MSVNGTTLNNRFAGLGWIGTANWVGARLRAAVDISQPYVPGSQPPYTPASPYLPLPIGFFQLSACPTDVVLDGTMALVDTGFECAGCRPDEPLAAVLHEIRIWRKLVAPRSLRPERSSQCDL